VFIMSYLRLFASPDECSCPIRRSVASSLSRQSRRRQVRSQPATFGNWCRKKPTRTRLSSCRAWAISGSKGITRIAYVGGCIRLILYSGQWPVTATLGWAFWSRD